MIFRNKVLALIYVCMMTLMLSFLSGFLGELNRQVFAYVIVQG
jgi:hypothetical protein